MLQFYRPKTNYDKKYGWKFAPMYMIFDANQQDLQDKARLVVSGHVVDSAEHTTYQICVFENNAIDSCEELVRTHGWRYW